MTDVGVIGTGSLGRNHARILTEIPSVTVAGFVDANDAIAAEIESTLKLKRYESVAALAKDIDCAVVATPTTTHYAVALELLEADVDVLIEKPITSTVDEAKRLIELAKVRGCILQVGHIERYNPAIIAVADLVRRTRYFEAERLGVFVPRSLDIDVLLDLMIHDLNLVLSLMRQEVVEIRAVGVPALTDKVDITNVRLALANGAVANLTASRISQERIRKQRFFGGDFYYSVDTKEQEVKGFRLANGVIQPASVTVEKKEPLRAELEAFLHCVETGERPIVAGEDGLAAVELALRIGAAIDESVRSFRL
ncbi:MAG TPA: Gfo/Idh/MocA family oxidoreductase [Thermoanaerobaculia bacterium]|nr:Gfo/Idh/MocA family oxidoreductase [Thermoanaerobaculia bacterium]